MSRRPSPTLVGAFVVSALTLAVAGIMLFSSGALFRDARPFVLYFDGSVSGLRQGSPVKFRGVEVGQVTGIYLELGEGQPSSSAAIPVTIDLFQDRIRAKGIEIDLDDPAWYQGVIDAGMRGQLQTQSLVTGQLYVGLDVHPGSPAIFRGGPDTPYPEIPTLPTAFEEIQEKLIRFVSRLDEVEIDSISMSARRLMDSLNNVASSPSLVAAIESLDRTLQAVDLAVGDLRDLMASVEADVLPLANSVDSTRIAATATLQQAEAALLNLRTLLEPGSPLVVQLEQMLADLSAASESLQAVADYLERNPGALVRGRKITEEEK
ncbi:MAG: MCE family protein [Gemmatimonadota bacterium]|nr:MAG: MCE family protein [Gemmatimonadota bacterium]